MALRPNLRSPALRALKFSRSGRTLGSALDLGNEMALLQISDSLAGADFSQPTPVDRLVNHDGERGDTAMVDTLRAYLDAFGNIPTAARELGYHPNSFRYRLRKLEELSGINLDVQMPGCWPKSSFDCSRMPGKPGVTAKNPRAADSQVPAPATYRLAHTIARQTAGLAVYKGRIQVENHRTCCSDDSLRL
ncbi:CdaR family transcriptional regulator [Arthrobacter sp. AZCC_0090]|uniref:PucR family transcriptional regulator n=1 Tax=Arthrobacter sp. AZCC_0090 TaxID=2735881 RepID=UPI001610B488|nr:helix-turn-helix domain-containing protein [Arthrobacter sp. AZCC_0090]MBB6405963.1 hypothetical protein [Arthrobacter sp. AZCC_0090]